MKRKPSLIGRGKHSTRQANMDRALSNLTDKLLKNCGTKASSSGPRLTEDTGSASRCTRAADRRGSES